MTARVRISVLDPATSKWRVACTVEQLAEPGRVTRDGFKVKTLSGIITRFGDTIAPAVAGKLDGRKVLYWPTVFKELLDARPGTGAHLRKEKRT